jgi:hypothetical protein
MRKLLFLLILVLAGYIGYMYFFGKGEDKSNAQTVVRESKDLVKSLGDFLKVQKDKYDDGQFDQLIDKVGQAVEKLKSSPAESKGEAEQTLDELENELKQIDPQKLSEENRKKLKEVLEELN